MEHNSVLCIMYFEDYLKSHGCILNKVVHWFSFVWKTPLVYLEVGRGSTKQKPIYFYNEILAIFKGGKGYCECHRQYFNWMGFIINVS